MQRPILILVAAAAVSCNGTTVQTPAPTDRQLGQTAFISADVFAGPRDDRTGGVDYDDPTENDGDERTVEEGDIYRLLGPGLLANLNAYRGLQIIDIADPESPTIVGRLQVSGWPVEMYVIDDTVLVLMNEWYGYGGVVGSPEIAAHDGGVVLSVDIADPSTPVLLDRAIVPGSIQTSRVTREGEAAALYVVTGGWWDWEGDGGWTTHTVVQSFDVASGALVPITQVDLGGYVAAVHATPTALLVARTDWESGEGASRVSLLDIQDAAGGMLAGGETAVAGRVATQFNLDLAGDVLRVVSGSTWGGTATNHLQTFDASTFGVLTEIDHETFGDGETLFATLFLGERAFFVTYLMVDPFHAFSIDAAGDATEISEFTVSGWNEFFRAVMGDSRLIGIGVNDDAGRTLAVSLYDVTDLSNAEPLVARSDVAADQSWSEATWDAKAFSVLEDAVDVQSPGGDRETGLILLPFTGYQVEDATYTAAVQLFTFSESSLTRRALMVHGTPVRRSFLAATSTTANLSDTELSLFDSSDPDACTELGRLELAPSYTDVFPFGAYLARVHDARDEYGGWWGAASALPPSTVEIVSAAGNPDIAPAVASFSIPAASAVHRTGALLVAMHSEALDTSEWPYTYETTLEVWDLADPTAPAHTGTLMTSQLQPGSWAWPAGPECLACDTVWGWGYSSTQVTAVPGGLVFWQPREERELVGLETVCTTTPAQGATCPGDPSGPDCVRYLGSVECRSLVGAEPYCSGEIVACDGGSDWSCESIDPSDIETESTCWQREQYRSWQRVTIEVLDLRNPEAPALAPTVQLAPEEEAVGMLADGSDIWITVKVPTIVPGDPRAYVRYSIHRLDLSVPSAPALGAAINVPGALVAIDGSTLFTRDQLWADSTVATSVARSVLEDGHARLEAWRAFTNRTVDALLLDGAGHVLVSHGLSWHDLPVVTEPGAVDDSNQDQGQRLTVIDAASATLAVLSEAPVGDWATLTDARAGRALFQVPGGLLVFNLDDPAAPYPQAFFALRGWPSDILVEGTEILFAAGRFGVYRFDLDTFNLLPP